MPFLRHALLIGISAIGLSACGGSGGDGTPAQPQAGSPDQTPTPGMTDGTAASTGNTAAPAPSGLPDTADTVAPNRDWNLRTGAHAPDMLTLASALPVSIALDTMTVSSPSPRLSVQATSATITTVTLDGQPVLTLTREAGGVTLNSTVSGTTRLAYHLTGTSNTPLTLYSSTDYRLILDGVVLNSPDGPALNLPSPQTAHVELRGASTLTDSAQWRPRNGPDGKPLDMKATLFAEGPIVFRGTGSLAIQATARHALASDSHLRLISGSLSLQAAARDGIRATDAFVMDGGTLSIDTPAGKGIKVDGQERTDRQALGFVAINDGTLTIRSHDKALSAAWEAEDDARTTAVTDDPDPRVTINGGTLHITTTGPVRNDSDDPKDENAPSPEGIEAKSVLTIHGGDLRLDTMDDAFNAGTHFEMTAGRVHAHSRHNDAIDSNGTIAIRGGVLVATSQGPEPEGAIDSDGSDFIVTGGTFVGLGYYNSTPSATKSTQNIVSITNGRNDAVAPGLWTLRDARGQVAFSFQVPFAGHYMTVSSPRIATGTTYSLVTGGTLGTVGSRFHGLAIEPTTHTGGTAQLNFTVQDRLTPLGRPFEWSPAGP